MSRNRGTSWMVWVALALAIGSCTHAEKQLTESREALRDALERETAVKLQLDVLRRAELERQMQWRKNFIPSEVRELFEREA